MTALSKAYQLLLRKFPTGTQAAQTGILMGTGDIIAQVCVEKKSLAECNYVRTAQFTGMGVFMAGPTLTIWYRILARTFGESKKVSVAAKKVACDQLFFAPTFIAIFLSTLGAVQGRPFERIKSELKDNYLDIVKMNYTLWPAVQIVNFYVVPLQYQVLLVQSVALVWNTYISWKTQAVKEDEQKLL